MLKKEFNWSKLRGDLIPQHHRDVSIAEFYRLAMKIISPLVRKTLVVALLLAMANSANSNLFLVKAKGNDKASSQIIGQLTTSGTVTVNDKKAINGTSIFNNSKLNVACANGNKAFVNLGRLGRVEMAPGSQMVLRFSDGLISGDLITGKIVVSSAAGVKVAINTSEGVSAADGKDASLLAVSTQRGVRCVPVMMGQSNNSVANLSSGALAAILLGTGGLAGIGALVATDSQASGITP